MNLIVAVDEKWGIGKNGDLLFSIPEDMKFFRTTTAGKVVVMGRATLESLPNNMPLKNRVNLVLSRNTHLNTNGAVLCNDMDSLFDKLSEYNKEDIYIIGGADIYNALLKYCDMAYVTRVQKTADADRYITNIESLDNWSVVKQSDIKEHEDTKFTFVTYKNASPEKWN